MTSNDLGPVGDMLQRRDHLATATTVTRSRGADGSTVEETSTRTAGRGHHTAIARSVPDVDGVPMTLAQHVSGRDVVHKLSLPTRSIAKTVTYPKSRRKHPRTRRIEPVDLMISVAVEVTGRVCADRPKSK